MEIVLFQNLAEIKQKLRKREAEKNCALWFLIRHICFVLF